MTNDNLIFVFEKDTLRILNIGEINRFNPSAMREEIDEKICEFSPKQVVLDLSQTVISHPFDLKCAVGLIVGRHRLLEELQAELVIENPNPHTLKCLKSNGVDKLIKIVNSK